MIDPHQRQPRASGPLPIVGIAGDVDLAPGGDARAPATPRSCCRLTYVHALAHAGAVPIVLPPVVEQIAAQLACVQGVLLIGGDDPRTEPFGQPTDPRVTPVHPIRQAYDQALLQALGSRPELPVLGVCYGMQMMALAAGGGRCASTCPMPWGRAGRPTGTSPTPSSRPRPPRRGCARACRTCRSAAIDKPWRMRAGWRSAAWGPAA
ncbi:MAG: hypothetical protein KatS3mg103_1364 [Phycisphaerales bacterium]|nr:MAG: hypothetical protein KatS3mg103_1364 [Phycisphaerales bacterium]